MRDDSVYLEYIDEAIDLIQQYLGGPTAPLDRDRFYTDSLTQDAVIRRLETLGEATNHLSAELRSRHPEVDWPKVTGFRNILAHAYMDLELDLIWKTIVEDLAALKAVAESELK
jgi:uncharacterized protein with HEPN domain